jgi:hypothetical protein
VEHHADVLERSAAKGPLAAVIAFCEILADSAGHGKWEIGLYDSRQYMRLVSECSRKGEVEKLRVTHPGACLV